MTGNLERIEDQLRRGLEGGARHGPAVLELLAGGHRSQAHARAIGGSRCGQDEKHQAQCDGRELASHALISVRVIGVLCFL
jgi:hypothetical protein